MNTIYETTTHMENKLSQTPDEQKTLGGKNTIDPQLGTALMFNLRQTDQAILGFHPKHERTVPKAHVPSDYAEEESSFVAAVRTHTFAQTVETPFRQTELQEPLQESLQESPVESSSEETKYVDTSQNSLKKSSGGSRAAGFASSKTSTKPSGSSVPVTSGTSLDKKFPLNRERDPFSSTGSILPPLEPESASPDKSATPDENCDVSKKVRMQYEKLPYPFRDPQEDKKRLTMPLIDNLMIVNQRCFQGKKNFHGEFRMLVAGGGTGDASTYLAVQTAWLPDAKVVYVDLSTESMKIATQRLHNQAVRLGQPNIEKIVEFHHGSLLDVEKMGLGKFDYINCSGVLHHLKDPNEGLAALRNVLKEDGAMSIMVYGQVGRTTIYQMQELMRIVNRNVDDMDEKIKNTNLFLRHLPSSNLHRLGGRWGANESNPVEIYDLFLHSQDRAYTVEQLYDWVEGCGMHITAFSSGQHSFLAPELYPHTLSRRLRERIKKMSVREQRIFSELLYGHINKFEFHLTPQLDPGIDWFDMDLIPCFSLLAKQQNMPSRLAGTEESALAFHLPNHLDKLSLTIQTSPFAKGIYRQINDTATLGDIHQKMRSLYPQMSDAMIHRDILLNLKQLMQFDILHIRHKSCRCELLNRDHF